MNDIKDERTVAAINAFLKNEKVLVLEPSSSFGQSIMGCLVEMGSPPENLFFVKRFKEAWDIMEKEKPKVLLTEFSVDGKAGLSLVDLQNKFYDDSTKTAVLVTHNDSQTAVAEAAEEHVDAYILKPFSMGDFKLRLTTLFGQKIYPSDYSKSIKAGRNWLESGDYDKAVESFKLAVHQSSQPSLAYYYTGQTRFLQGNYQKAVVEFAKGLKVNPLHYKCLMGEFDSLFAQKKYEQAYLLVPRIRENYPISPQRLGKVLISAVFSQNFEDLSIYYYLYQNLETRPADLTKVFSAGLMTAAKHFAALHSSTKAIELFEMGMAVTGPDPSYLDQIVRELIRLKALEKAEEFLRKFRSEDVGSAVHARLVFLLSCHLDPRDMAIEKGKKLVAQKTADLDCFKSLIKIIRDIGNQLLAEDMAQKAIQEFPDQRAQIYQLLEA
jgi:tetratricopeptide (TPR) repeat protein